MNKLFSFLGIFLIPLVLLHCSNGMEKKPDRADAFLKITEKSKGLFNKEARINNYKNSTANSENLKSSLESNYKYSGYGSSKKKSPSFINKEKNTDKKKKVKKVNFKKSTNNRVFSAYSTN